LVLDRPRELDVAETAAELYRGKVSQVKEQTGELAVGLSGLPHRTLDGPAGVRSALRV
jgi:hypothetical protein